MNNYEVMYTVINFWGKSIFIYLLIEERLEPMSTVMPIMVRSEWRNPGGLVPSFYSSRLFKLSSINIYSFYNY